MTNIMINLVIFLRKQQLFRKLFHTMDYCICDQLKDCQTVLDIGCGPDSPLKNCGKKKYSVGVEPFVPYFELAKKSGIHTRYLNCEIEDINFPDKSFDAILMIDVIEHMSMDSGMKLLKKINKWAKKKIVITTPNGYFSMGSIDGNSLQAHLSGWTVSDFNKLGYKCNGMTGAKMMYLNENQVENFSGASFSFENMRFNPKSLSFVINAFLQIFVYFIPEKAFELIAVKEVS